MTTKRKKWARRILCVIFVLTIASYNIKVLLTADDMGTRVAIPLAGVVQIGVILWVLMPLPDADKRGESGREAI